MSNESTAMPTADSAPAESGAEAINNENLDPQLSTQGEGSLESAVEDAVAAGATKQEIKELIEEFEIKVNGKTSKKKINLADKNEVKKMLQMAYAGQGAMQEKAELEKLINSELMRAKEDPWTFLKEQLGLDPEALNEEYIGKRVEEMKKSPEQLERERAQKELAEARKKLKEIEEEKQSEKQMRLHQQAAMQLDMEITDALQNDPELPKTRKTVRRIADMLMWAMDNGFPDATVKDVLPSVKKEIQDEATEYYSALPVEALEKMIGVQNIDRLRKKRLAAAKAAPQNVEARPVAPQKTENKPTEKMNSKDFFRKLARGEA